MATFKYTLPSGATFTMNAPTGTTQAAADKIFYEQVAAGTFVGYKPGDTLTHPAEALTNFGLSRLQRGTADVNDQALLAITAGLPVVTPLPTTLSSIPIQNVINQTNFIQVNSNPIDGLFTQGPSAIGGSPTSNGGSNVLSATQTQAVMAQVANFVSQAATVMTQASGVGKYGFNAQQLERAGYIKPGYAQRYCRIDPTTQENPSNFVAFMNAPTVWTGLNGVDSVDAILNNEALQNQIQQELMLQSYNAFVSTGVIVPQNTSTSSLSTGHVYGCCGALISAGPVSLLASPQGSGLTTSAVGTAVGSVPCSVSNFGSTAVATYQAGLSSLSSGATNFSTSALSSASIASGTNTGQLSGLATGLTGGAAASATSAVTSATLGDVGALLAVGSTVGPALTAAWATGSNALSNLSSANISGLAGTALTGIESAAGTVLTGAEDAAKAALTGVTGAAMGLLGKASQFATSLGDQLSGLVSGVQKAPAFTNTVDRATLDAAVTRVIGSDKIASPTFELPSPTSLGISADISQAKNLLSQAQTAGSGLLGQAQGTLAQAQGTAQNVLSQGTGQAATVTKNLLG